VLLLSPYAPHIAEELWQRLGHSESLAYEPWPQVSRPSEKPNDRIIESKQLCSRPAVTKYQLDFCNCETETEEEKVRYLSAPAVFGAHPLRPRDQDTAIRSALRP
jgi:leucyl-tRNA synthetase